MATKQNNKSPTSRSEQPLTLKKTKKKTPAVEGRHLQMEKEQDALTRAKKNKYQSQQSIAAPCQGYNDNSFKDFTTKIMCNAPTDCCFF